MANQLDEMNTQPLDNGRDVNVIAKQIPVKVGFGSTLFEIMLWVLGIIPGVIFLIQKIKAQNYFLLWNKRSNTQHLKLITTSNNAL